MKKPKFKKGQILPIYLDYKSQREFYGQAELLEFNSECLTFYDERKKTRRGELETIYSAERWRAKVTLSHYYPKGYVKHFWFRKKVTDSNDLKSISRNTTYSGRLEFTLRALWQLSSISTEDSGIFFRKLGVRQKVWC